MNCEYGYCKNEDAVKYENGLYFCQKHIIDAYRAHDINKLLIDKQEEMKRNGIKKGSFKWVIGILQTFKNKTGYVKINYVDDYKNGGVWAVIKVFIISKFFIK